MKAPPEEQQNNELAQWNSRKRSQLTFPRVMYCVGAIARIDNVIQNYYLNPFLLDIVGLKPSLTGNVLLIKQIWDAITDPMIGYASDNLNSSFGRRKPFVYASSPFLWAAWIMLWLQIDAISESQLAMFFYYLLTLLMFNLMSTSQAVPYRALLQDIAPTYGIRTKMVAVQEMVAMFSFMVAVFVQGLISEKFKYPESGETNYKVGYIVCALIFAPFVGFTRVFTAAFVDEKPVKGQSKNSEAAVILPLAEERDDGEEEDEYDDDDDDDDDDEPKSQSMWDALVRFLVIWKCALAFKDFSLLSLSWLIANVLLSLVTANLLLYVKYYLGDAQYGTYMVVCLQLGIAISLPVWALVIRAIGKKKALFCGCLCLSCCILGAFFLQEGQALILLILLPFCGCCAGSLYICLTAMQPDCVEAYYLKHQQRHEGVLYSIFLLAGKIGSAVSLAVSSYVLALTGYVSAKDGGDGIVQNEATQQALRIMVFGAPLVLMVIICFIVFFIKDYKADFATYRATVTGVIFSERVSTKRLTHKLSAPAGISSESGATSQASYSSPSLRPDQF